MISEKNLQVQASLGTLHKAIDRAVSLHEQHRACPIRDEDRRTDSDRSNDERNDENSCGTYLEEAQQPGHETRVALAPAVANLVFPDLTPDFVCRP